MAIDQGLDALLRSLGDSRFSTIDALLPGGVDVADSPEKAFTSDSMGRRTGVLMLSNHVNPDFVARAVRNGRMAKEKLGPDVGAPVLTAAVDGTHDGRSFAIWPLHLDVQSRGRLTRAVLQRGLLRRRAKRWIEDVARESREAVRDATDIAARFIAPLEHMVKREALSRGLRARAQTSIARIEERSLTPVHVLQHGDYWLGNCLLPIGTSNAYGLVVIDWGGGRESGYPFADVLRLCMSYGASVSELGRVVQRHCGIVQCTVEDVGAFVLASLGEIGSNLEHFPEDRYLVLCERMNGLVDRLGGHA